MKFSPDRFFILGISSWIGSLLAIKVPDFFKNVLVAGTSCQSDISFSDHVVVSKVCTPENIILAVENARPQVLFNFLRGENEDGFILHENLCEYCRRTGCFYVYASSALALDGYAGKDLCEDLLPNSISHYGKFKGRCENILIESTDIQSLILRFASIQGWTPHKASRNQVFLEKILQGEKIRVDRGVLQNRLLDTNLVEMILQLVKDQITGVCHLGTVDASDEIDFLTRQAQLFGWKAKIILPGGHRNVNLFVRPGRILSLYGKRFFFTEEDTLHSLSIHSGLQRYIKS